MRLRNTKWINQSWIEYQRGEIQTRQRQAHKAARADKLLQ